MFSKQLPNLYLWRYVVESQHTTWKLSYPFALSTKLCLLTKSKDFWVSHVLKNKDFRISHMFQMTTIKDFNEMQDAYFNCAVQEYFLEDW